MTTIETDIIAALQARGFCLECDKAGQMQHYITYHSCLQSLCGALLNAMASAARFTTTVKALHPVTAFQLPTTLFWQTEPALDIIFEHEPCLGYVESIAYEIHQGSIDQTKMQPYLGLIRQEANRLGKYWAQERFSSLIQHDVLYLTYDSALVTLILRGTAEETRKLLWRHYRANPPLYQGAAYLNGYVCDEFGGTVETGDLDLLGHQRDGNVEQEVATHFRLRKLRYLAS